MPSHHFPMAVVVLFLVGLAVAMAAWTDNDLAECQHLYLSYNEVLRIRRLRDPGVSTPPLVNYWRHRLDTACPPDLFLYS